MYAALGDRAMEADCLNLIAQVSRMAGRPRSAITAARAAYTFSLEIEGGARGVGASIQSLALGLLEVGEYTEALALAQQIVDMLRAHYPPKVLPGSLMLLGTVQRALLALEAARATHEEAMRITEAEPSSWPFLTEMLATELCADCALAGDWAIAQAYARQALTLEEQSWLLFTGMTQWLDTEALLRAGDIEPARALVQRLGEHARDNRRFRIPYLRSLAMLAQWDGDTAQAITHLEEADALAEEIGLPGERWQILAALAELHHAGGDEEGAWQAFAVAAEIAQALADKVEDEGRRTGFLAARKGRLSSVRSVFG